MNFVHHTRAQQHTAVEIAVNVSFDLGTGKKTCNQTPCAQAAEGLILQYTPKQKRLTFRICKSV